MKTLELTDEEAAVLWFIGRQMRTMSDMVTTRPRGRETVESLSAKIMALAVDEANGEQSAERP